MINKKIYCLLFVLSFGILMLGGILLRNSYASDPHLAEESTHGDGHAVTTEGHVQAEHADEHHGAESWWRFPGWQIIFAAISCLYFGLVLAYLPLLVAKEVEGGHH